MSAMLVKSVLPEHGVPGLDQAWKAVDMALLTNIVQEETCKEIAFAIEDGNVFVSLVGKSDEDDVTELCASMRNILVFDSSSINLLKGVSPRKLSRKLSAESSSSGGASESMATADILKTLMVTVRFPATFPSFENRQKARAWVQKVLDPKFAAHVGRSVIFDPSTIKQYFLDMSLAQYREEIKPSLLKLVSSADEEDEEALKRTQEICAALGKKRGRQAEQVGQLEKTMSVVDRLAAIHGISDDPEENIKFARLSTELIHTSQVVCASGLKEVDQKK